MLLFDIRKTRYHFGPRLLYFGYSPYRLALDLPFAIQLQDCTRLSLQILADTIPPVLPVLMLKYQCHQKIITFQIILSNLRYQAPVKYHTNFPQLHIKCHSQHLICKRYPAPILKPLPKILLEPSTNPIITYSHPDAPPL